jgi:hypothetical protein
LRQQEPAEEETEVQPLIHQIALEHRPSLRVSTDHQNCTVEACR